MGFEGADGDEGGVERGVGVEDLDVFWDFCGEGGMLSALSLSKH